ncbi:hypothetical protein [Plantactinospora soyae]|uniref:Uncharacterized protein n=1 Tax=Plantactinospora soyae TaxID=1544732 RepID=A0A927QXY5_9ACTN|nr:hypothetical protein [Plantactinospora soyae]MBE1487262.1 hypothetical protein [Plantactinospora soyae]
MRMTTDAIALLCEPASVPTRVELAAMTEVAARHVPLDGHCLDCRAAVGASGWCWIREVAEQRLRAAERAPAQPARSDASPLPIDPSGRNQRDVWRRG